MAKRNSSGGSSGRRGSSRNSSGGSSSNRRSDGRKTFRKSDSRDDDREKRPSRARTSRSDSSSSDSRRKQSGDARKPPRTERPKSDSRNSTSRAGYGAKRPSFNKRNEDETSPRSSRPRQNSRFKSKREESSEPREKRSGEERGFFKKSKSRYAGKPAEKTNVQPDLKAPVQTDKVRLNKYIANSGVCSRREADELIAMGLVSVNGTTITEMGYKVNPGDEVRYENKVLKAEKPVYVLMNKPKGFLTTTEDPQERNTVMHILGGNIKERIYPVGRLDRNTTGLLLLTNDGDLAEKLMHPSYNVKKIYKVELDRPLTKADFQTITEGVLLDEGRALVDDIAIVSPDGKTVGLEIHIGWNRVVRRIFEALQYQVLKLDRTVYAGLDKKDLGRGQWRFLSKEEIVRLKHLGSK